ncbi:MAG TPA: 3-dehydroquinate synthase [Thermomicrobiales bacterium]|nr:3-dehydroquinate synthase [Thermomicrobiales bacterium]
MTFRRVVLIGMSGAGKSTVGRMLAGRLGWRLIDLDAEIERRQGRSIPDIFRTSGEDVFRAIERQEFRAALESENAVISTGGGAVTNEEAWGSDLLGASGTLSVLLDAPAEVLYQRLVEQQAQDPSGAIRPMLSGSNPLARIRALLSERDRWYRRAGIVLPVGDRTVDEVTGLVADALGRRSWLVGLDVSGAASRIYVGADVLDFLGVRISEQWPKARRVWIVADEDVAGYHLQATVSAAERDGAEVRTLTFPSGEASKSLAGLGGLYDGLLRGGIERSDVIVALGGGVAGDLVGFAAATVLRGGGLVQVPTTLLAMVDSSVGGKTGINHPAGKNLIGAFYQSPVVLIAPEMLKTLPNREYRSGWAEIIKHGLIEPTTPAGDSGLFDLVVANARLLNDRASPLLNPIIARNVEIKASVVQADEREAGLRAILNFGHTIGHAIEAAGYTLLHGEAIAVGLHGAMRFGEALGRVSSDRVDEVVSVLEAFGLPTTVDIDSGEIRRRMQSDKKRVAGRQQWIVPLPEGGVSVERGVPETAVDAALAAIIARDSA